jgi:hypothetical protein
MNAVMCRGLRVTYRQVLNWMIGFIDTLSMHTIRDYRQYSAIADLHTISLLHTHLGSSLVVSWQRIYNSLTVTSNHT